MTGLTSCRPWAVAAAFVLMAMGMFLGTSTASAQECCGIGIYNNTDCPYRVTLTTAAGDSVLAVPVGGDSYTIPGCRPFRLSITDRCGVVHHFPTVIGDCITVDLGAGCCLVICKISTCRWSTSVTHCLCGY